jgi:hypothetical protein
LIVLGRSLLSYAISSQIGFVFIEEKKFQNHLSFLFSKLLIVMVCFSSNQSLRFELVSIHKVKSTTSKYNIFEKEKLFCSLENKNKNTKNKDLIFFVSDESHID